MGQAASNQQTHWFLCQSLEREIQRIGRVFDIDEILGREKSNQTIIEYYNQSRFLFKLFQSTRGAMHFSLSNNNKFRRRDVRGQAERVQSYIDQYRPAEVLELGSGTGFNSIYLAKRNPTVKFTGIDLVPGNVREAEKKSGNISNVEFYVADFEALHFPEQSFDLVFAIESICYTGSNNRRVFAQIYKLLKPNSVAILFDGIRGMALCRVESVVRCAAQLVEASMAVVSDEMIDFSGV